MSNFDSLGYPERSVGAFLFAAINLSFVNPNAEMRRVRRKLCIKTIILGFTVFSGVLILIAYLENALWQPPYSSLGLRDHLRQEHRQSAILPLNPDEIYAMMELDGEIKDSDWILSQEIETIDEQLDSEVQLVLDHKGQLDNVEDIQRTSLIEQKIASITWLNSESSVMDHHLQLFMKKCHCLLHKNHDFVVLQNFSIPQIKKTILDYDWALVSPSSSIITKPGHSLHQFLAQLGSIKDAAMNIIFISDYLDEQSKFEGDYIRKLLSPFAFLVRNSERSLRFLEVWNEEMLKHSESAEFALGSALLRFKSPKAYKNCVNIVLDLECMLQGLTQIGTFSLSKSGFLGKGDIFWSKPYDPATFSSSEFPWKPFSLGRKFAFDELDRSKVKHYLIVQAVVNDPIEAVQYGVTHLFKNNFYSTILSRCFGEFFILNESSLSFSDPISPLINPEIVQKLEYTDQSIPCITYNGSLHVAETQCSGISSFMASEIFPNNFSSIIYNSRFSTPMFSFMHRFSSYCSSAYSSMPLTIVWMRDPVERMIRSFFRDCDNFLINPYIPCQEVHAESYFSNISHWNMQMKSLGSSPLEAEARILTAGYLGLWEHWAESLKMFKLTINCENIDQEGQRYEDHSVFLNQEDKFSGMFHELVYFDIKSNSTLMKLIHDANQHDLFLYTKAKEEFYLRLRFFKIKMPSYYS